MKAERLAVLMTSALLAAAVAGAPALANPDPTTGAGGSEQGPALVTPTSAVAPEQAGGADGGFDWTDAAVGATVALGAAALVAGTLRFVRARPERQPLTS